jgi:hypothetical protein
MRWVERYKKKRKQYLKNIYSYYINHYVIFTLEVSEVEGSTL